jgi:hypothetical protein
MTINDIIPVEDHGRWVRVDKPVVFGDMVCRPDFHDVQVGDFVMVTKNYNGTWFFNPHPEAESWKHTASFSGVFVLEDKATGFVTKVYKFRHGDAMKFNMKNPGANEHNGFYYFIEVGLADGKTFAKVVINSTSCVSDNVFPDGLLIYKWEPNHCLA